jgi:excinuclease ABC subunit C
MVGEAEVVSFIKVGSELEALLLEAYLIKKFQPRYNFISKDDKHPLYIKITEETFPRVITARKIDQKDYLAFYGPFPSSKSVKDTLRMLRRIFPYSDHKVSQRPCLYSHMGLCNPCPSYVQNIKNVTLQIKLRKKYLENIRHLKAVLGRKISGVTKELTRKMEKFAKSENFEEAERVKEQLTKLNYITQSQNNVCDFLDNVNFLEDVRQKELSQLTEILTKYVKVAAKISRIECYDVAHLAGVSPTASMVTFINGEPDKAFYRHFRIQQSRGADDIASLTEVAKRRSQHLGDWGKPDLIIVDGGKSQVQAFSNIVRPYKIPVIGIAKRYETLVIPRVAYVFHPSACPTARQGGCQLTPVDISKRLRIKQPLNFAEIRLNPGPALDLVQRLRNEAHRFARRYHHHLLKKSWLVST